MKSWQQQEDSSFTTEDGSCWCALFPPQFSSTETCALPIFSSSPPLPESPLHSTLNNNHKHRNLEIMMRLKKLESRNSNYLETKTVLNIANGVVPGTAVFSSSAANGVPVLAAPVHQAIAIDLEGAATRLVSAAVRQVSTLARWWGWRRRRWTRRRRAWRGRCRRFLGGVGSHGVDGANSVGDICVSLYIEVTIYTPASPPWVLHYPVVSVALRAVTHHQDRMVYVIWVIRAISLVDPLIIVNQLRIPHSNRWNKLTRSWSAARLADLSIFFF